MWQLLLKLRFKMHPQELRISALGLHAPGAWLAVGIHSYQVEVVHFLDAPERDMDERDKPRTLLFRLHGRGVLSAPGPACETCALRPHTAPTAASLGRFGRPSPALLGGYRAQKLPALWP